MTDKITKLTNQNVDLILRKATEKLNALAQEYGLTVQREPAKFRTNTLFSRFVFTCETAEGIPGDFANYASKFGLKPADYGRMFRLNGGVFEICGIRPRNRKYPILAKCAATGSVFKFPPSTVKLGLAVCA